MPDGGTLEGEAQSALGQDHKGTVLVNQDTGQDHQHPEDNVNRTVDCQQDQLAGTLKYFAEFFADHSQQTVIQTAQVLRENIEGLGRVLFIAETAGVQEGGYSFAIEVLIGVLNDDC